MRPLEPVDRQAVRTEAFWGPRPGGKARQRQPAAVVSGLKPQGQEWLGLAERDLPEGSMEAWPAARRGGPPAEPEVTPAVAQA